MNAVSLSFQPAARDSYKFTIDNEEAAAHNGCSGAHADKANALRKNFLKNNEAAKHTNHNRKAGGERKRGSAKNAVEQTAETLDGSPAYRPLTMERRAIRDLAREAEQQMEELEILAKKLIQQQEEQQQTISRELHDNVAQVLSVVTNRITLARTTSKIPAWLRQELMDMQESVNAALTDIRSLARGLRPSLLDHCGFAATLEKNGKDFRDRTGMDFELEVDPDAASFLDTSNLTHLFRLLQEAMQNIEEHSKAERAWIILAQQDGKLHLEVGDNGCAFTPQRVADAQADGHLGLLGMRERAELLGGSFHLEATPGKGTIIRVSVPVTPPTPEKTLTPSYENDLSSHR